MYLGLEMSSEICENLASLDSKKKHDYITESDRLYNIIYC